MTTAAPNRPETHTRLHRTILRKFALLRRVQVSLGRDLGAMHRSCAFLLHGATSFPLYCETFGLAGVEGLQLEAVTTALEIEPRLAAAVASGRVSVPAAAALGRLLGNPALLRPGDEWVRWAEEGSTRELLDRTRRRREESRAEGALHPLRAYLTPRGAVDFLRARELAIRREGRVLTEGETIERVADEYLDRMDPERQAFRPATAARNRARPVSAGTKRDNADTPPGARAGVRAEARAERAPATTVADPPRPRSRAIPADERRRVLRQAGDRCRVQGCDHAFFLDYCHRLPFRTGGPNTAENLLRFCTLHHRQFDAGEWRVLERPSGAILVDRRGVVVGRLRRDAPEARGAPATPPATPATPRPPPP
jgi:hypothetical protein